MLWKRSRAHTGANRFPHPRVFAAGTVISAAGVLMQVPMIFTMPGGMSGMDMSHGWTMPVGMTLTLVGWLAAAAGLVPERSRSIAGVVRVRSEASRLTGAHRKLVAALFVALVIDVMKPATIAFIEPGMRREYHISTAVVSLLPVFALTGTVIGSLMWGWLADRLGRRAAIFLALLMFVATTVCGAMPTFAGNLAMCTLMGLAAGGLLPIVYALMAETLPAGHRGWMMVMQASVATVAGYLLTSGIAAVLLPLFGWRVMWFVHLPFALLLIALSRWIPESPRFLIEHGRTEEAGRVMRPLGLVLDQPDETTDSGETEIPSRAGPLAVLVNQSYRSRTLVIGGYALAWGLIYWGFLTLLPSLVSASDVPGGTHLLVWSSALAVPGSVAVAFCYSRWSTRKTMALFGGLTAASLTALAITDLHGPPVVTVTLLVLLLVGSGAVIAVLSPYTAEVYPTSIRGLGTGMAAACSKAGGIFGPPVLAGLLALVPSARLIGIVAALPMALATIAIARQGVETRGRALEEIQPTRVAEPSLASEADRAA